MEQHKDLDPDYFNRNKIETKNLTESFDTCQNHR